MDGRILHLFKKFFEKFFPLMAKSPLKKARRAFSEG